MISKLKLPSEWKRLTIGKLGTISKGGGIPKSSLSSSGEPCILYGEIYTRYGEVVKKLTSRVSKGVAGQAVPIRAGDVLFAGSGETIEDIGKCVAYVGKKNAYAGGDTLILRPHGHDSTFLGYLLNSKKVNQEKAKRGQGSSVIHIYGRDLKSIEVVVPPPEEQRAIAGVLSDVDALIESLDALIAKKRDLKQATMQQLLTGKKRPFAKHIAGSKSNAEWQEVAIKDIVADLQAGVSVRSVSTSRNGGDAGHFVLKTSALDQGRFDAKERKSVVASDISRLKSRVVANSVLISRMNTIALVGECAFVESGMDNTFLPDRIWRVIFKNDARTSGRWFVMLLSSNQFRNQLRDIATGTSGSMKNIAKPSLLSLRIPVPPFAEQVLIGEIASNMDAEIDALIARRDKTKLLKTGLMQELLSGRRRLV
jgi:type I restriction enzyme S subunit